MERREANDEIDRAIIGIATEFPEYGAKRAADKLKKRGIKISLTGVRSLWLKNDFETYEKRIKALETKIAQGMPILTIEQWTALKRAKERREANGK